jgi:hypothetical protein
MLKAIVLPILIRAINAAIVQMTMTALTGTSRPGRTVEIQRENGTAPSRAKAKSWRDEPAMTVTRLKKLRMIMIDVMAFVDARDWVLL